MGFGDETLQIKEEVVCLQVLNDQESQGSPPGLTHSAQV